MSVNEARIWRLMAARLKSARGVVMLEFGVFAPLILLTVIFAADFLRVLYCEQQLEIACRALCDIEAHLIPGKRVADENPSEGYGFPKTYKPNSKGALEHNVSGCPGQPGKLIVMHYLADALGVDYKRVYARGYYYNQVGIMHNVLNLISDENGTLDGKMGALGTFYKVAKKIINKVFDLVTFRTDRYLTEVFPTDKVVAVSLSVFLEPTLNSRVIERGLFYRKATLSDSNASVIPMFEPDWTNQEGHRTRFYYHMPSFDTAPVAPDTYGRHMADAFKSWLKDE